MNARHRKNLRKLANYVLNLPDDYEHFSMSFYLIGKAGVFDPEEAKAAILTCGTTGCLLGHGPSAGISPRGCSGWWEYASAKFGLLTHGRPWRWCFGGSWDAVDNTPRGGALRILYMLDYGIPEGFGYPDENWIPLYMNAYEVVEQ